MCTRQVSVVVGFVAFVLGFAGTPPEPALGEKEEHVYQIVVKNGKYERRLTGFRLHPTGGFQHLPAVAKLPR